MTVPARDGLLMMYNAVKCLQQETIMSDTQKARAVGINHVALEVGDIDEALAFYGKFLEFTLRGKHDTMAFIDLGDQFIALSKVAERPRDHERHFGLVVDDKEAVGRILDDMGIEIVSDRFMDFYDPWGNRIEIVGYEGIQFSKTPGVLRGMGLDGLGKTDAANQELADKGMAPG
ncbi:MAG: VOC family protein [Hyphomicrobiaceae bacterium]